MPKNSYLGIFVAFFSFILGFGAIWHILWMFILGLIGIIAVIIIRSLDENTDRIIDYDDLTKMDRLMLRSSK